METTLASQTLLRGHFLHVQRDRVRLADGTEATREFIRHPGAVVVVAVVVPGERVWLAKDAAPREVREPSVIVEWQYRHPVGQIVLELPAGKVDPDEPRLMTAQRELREETGFVAAAWARAGAVMPTVAYADEVIDIWFARGLQQVGRALDEEERLDVALMTVDELNRRCLDGELLDSKSIACLWWLEQWRLGRWQPDWQPAPPLPEGP